MCIGLPMQVLATRDGYATVRGRGEQREVDTALIGPCEPGDWLLVFLDGARERLDAARAAEVNAALDLLEASLTGRYDPAASLDDPGFALPSRMSAEQLAALTTSPSTRTTAPMNVPTTEEPAP